MAKVQGNYSSIVRGVSQQAPADRLEGQHGEQLNMLSDPVRGLVRRNGTILENALYQAFSGPPDAAIKDSFSFRTFSYKTNTRDVDLIYRTRPIDGEATTNHLPGVIVYDKTQGDATFVDLVTDDADTDLQAFLEDGFSSVTLIGDYVLMSGAYVAPAYTSEDLMDGEQAWSDYAAVWVRGGAYARTYKVSVVAESDGLTYVGTYTTPPSAYPGTLDTSGISFSDPDYQKQINDLTYAYEAAVNQHIASASQAITPANIAQELIDSLNGAGYADTAINGSHIGLTNVRAVTVTDSGDGQQLRAVHASAQAADQVTDMHYPGRVVKVQPRTANEGSYYLRADAEDGVSTGLTPVVWRETAGTVQTPGVVLAIGLYHEGKFYLATSASTLHDIIFDDSGADLDVPDWVASASGDLETMPPPHFFGRVISALGVFQDRLMIVSDNVVNLSRPGDYFNFYRSSMLTVADDDPIEVYALGSDGDVIRKAALYDRNMLLYGDKYHYAMNGRIAQTPSTASIAIQYTMSNTAQAQPVGAGQILFALKEDSQLGASRLIQTQTGAFQDTPTIVDVSRQLRDYINGTPAEMVALTSPDIVFVRTEHFLKSTGAFPRSRPWGIYVYQYLDGEDGRRLLDSWSAWEWSSALGTHFGMSATASGDGIMLYTLAWGFNEIGDPVRGILAQTVSARPDPTGLPYLDGMRPAEDAAEDGLMTANSGPFTTNVTYTASGAAHSFAYAPASSDASRFTGLEHPHYTAGDAPPETIDPNRWSGVQGLVSDFEAAFPGAFSDDLWTGLAFPAYVDITSPFVRDFKGKAKTWGTLTLGRLRVTLLRSAGFKASFIDHIAERTSFHFSGAFERLNYGVNVWIGRNAREVQVRLAAVDWMPLTINAIEWAGQWFDTKRK